MPRSRANIGRRTRQTNRIRALRSQQTQEERTAENEQTRNRVSLFRAHLVEEQREIRNEEQRVRYRQARAAIHNTNRITFLRLAFDYDPTINYNSHRNIDIGNMDQVCAHCKALKYKNEAPGLCCVNGKVKLPELNQPPEPLFTLVSGTTPQSKHFLKNIRKYNTCFQMTSFGADNIITNHFMPTFKVQRQIYHSAGSLLPIPDEQHKFLQIYFLGNSDNEVNTRCAITSGIRRDIVQSLQNLFHQYNELVKLFKTAVDQMPSDNHKIIIRADKTPAGEHSRRFNAPTINEVAIVIIGDQFESRDIILHRRNDQLQRISETHRSYDALQYPILFWQGDDGYHFQLKMINPTTAPIAFMETPLMQTAQEHHPSVVKCQVLGDPKPKVLWKFDGRDVTSDRYDIIPEGLMIKNVSLEDRGMYTCRAYQVSQVTSMYEDRNIKLNIQHKPMFKKMVHAKVNQAYGFVGGEVNLTCEAVAEPAANFTWFRPYRRYTKLQGKIYQKRHWSMLQLYIHNASMFGDYLCKATNTLGTLDQIVTLLEGVKPPPPMNMLLRGVSSDTFNIEIQGPDLNRTDIPLEMLPFGYRIQYRRKTNDKQQLLGPDALDKWIGADSTDFYDVNVGGFYIINGLTDNTEYEIRAATRNIAGISDYTREVTYRTLRSHAQADSITSGAIPIFTSASLAFIITLAINFI